MRISDEDRDRAVDELRRHCVAGRLDMEEYGERVADALAARTLADLGHALRDLPRLRIAEPGPNPPGLEPQDCGPGAAGGPAMGAWRARLVLLASVVVVAVGVVFLVLAQWVWASILVVAWVAGLVQGRVPLRRQR
jgi:hypothetical protein